MAKCARLYLPETLEISSFAVIPKKDSEILLKDGDKNFSVIAHIDPAELTPKYIVGDIITKKGEKNDKGFVVLTYIPTDTASNHPPDSYGVSLVFKSVGDWYYFRSKGHPERKVYGTRKDVERDYPVLITHFDLHINAAYIREPPGKTYKD